MLLRYGMSSKCRASDVDMTHMVLGNQHAMREVEVECARRGVSLVDRQWLLQSAKKRQLLPTEDFAIADIQTKQSQSTPRTLSNDAGNTRLSLFLH